MIPAISFDVVSSTNRTSSIDPSTASVSSITKTNSIGESSTDFLDSMMLSVVDMEKQQRIRDNESAQLDPSDPVDELRQSTLNLQTTISVSSLKKAQTALTDMITKVAISPQ